MNIFYVLFIFWIYIFLDVEAAILEKTASVCNGECSNLLMQCPPAHKIAIREALYGVHAVSSPCPYSFSCEDAWKDVCCDMAAGRDCLFPYPLDHLETFHRDCSGNIQCTIKTDQKPEASPACSPVEHRNVSSYSLIDYVCVNDTFTADMCSPLSVSIRGRTLFAMFDARREVPPPPGSVCACAATPTSWSGKGRVSAFVVDMRLNKPSSTWCSDSELLMEAQPKIHEITCLASHDPYFPYPFVSILNSTNGAISRLVINEIPPEFVWIGFEASKDEEVQLTCGLQPSPTTTSAPPAMVVPKEKWPNNVQPKVIDPPQRQPERRKAVPTAVALACGIIGGVLIIGIGVLIALWIYRRRLQNDKATSIRNDPYLEEHLYADVDESAARRRAQSVTIEPLYHTVGVPGATTDVYSSPWDSRSELKFKDNDGFKKDDDSDDLSGMYVTSEQVRRNKKNGMAGDDGGTSDEYVSVSEIRKKKEKKVTFNKNLEEYDRLNYRRKTSVDDIPSGYSHLGICINDQLDEELDTSLKDPPTVEKDQENTEKNTEDLVEKETSFIEEVEKKDTLTVEGNDDDGDSTQARASDDDSGLSTDEEKEGETTLSVPVTTARDRPPSPSLYALAKSFSTE
ncbi:uncharacterized protein LOC124116420 [Haliotis rufescens]|uniref:uncharacterized protein LOC124116420 n=1 Tax=Haliotis rufescens TaxID=6454 RepID=UPI00201F06AA|nr:uncharacterized protein LOC124116420 [Haliotis rufescens]